MTREHLPIRLQEGLAIDELNHVEVDNEAITLRRYRQSGLSGSLPALLYMHGGGFVTGGLETDDYMCREVGRQLPVVVLSVEYRLAPEHPFPTGIEDCFTVIEWVTSKAGQEALQVDLSRGLILGGTSAGGNFTASLAHAMLERDVKPQPTGLLFMASSFCHPDVRPEQFRNRVFSVDEVDDAPGLTVKSIHYFADKYGAPKDDKRYSPLLYESRAGLAKKAFFQICGWDPRRDEAILFSDLLQQEGIQVDSRIYQGLPHGFWTTCPERPESKNAIQDTVDGVRWLLA
ncbi:Putative alpha/beta hydrolase-3 [Septoria linicola]|uniref:Alpha/beta hydrolase-3 n=1 Tax=Septoria linicola TaxID=215465 RepID=A0A9Q9ASS9_9PEZI|nr:Putative alpha/beta hydrolase-3 [Septoria linicola]